MTTRTEGFMVEACKQQLDTVLGLIEAMADGAIKLREMQIEAATDAHADAVATRKSIAAATGMEQLLELQAQWGRANAEKCAAYWRAFYELAASTQSELARRLFAQAPAMVGDDEPKKAMLSLIDNAYKQWLDTTQQFYKLPAIAAEHRAEKRAAA